MILTDAIERDDYDIELTTDGIAITHTPSGAQFTVGSDGSVTADALAASGTNLTLGSDSDIGDATTIGNVAAQQIDAQPSDNPNAVAVDSQLKAKDVIDEGRRLNDLYRAIGQSQFELGLTQLEYDTGQFDTFVDGSKVDSQSEVSIDGSVALIEPLTFGDVDGEFTGHTNYVYSVFIDGSYGYSGSNDNTVKKWDTDTMTEQNEFTGHTSTVESVYIDGSYGYSGSGDYTVKKWDTDTMAEQAEFTGHTSNVYSVYIDGSYGYSGSGDYTVKKWDTDTMTEQAEFTGHTGTVYSVYIDGSYGYSGSYDDSVKKWDTDTMTQQNEFTGHTNSVYSVYIDGSYGYSGSNDNTVKKWGEKQSGSNQGTVEHQFKDVGFVPERVVLGYDAAQNDGSLYFEVEDDAGNIEQFSNPDTEITLSSISTQNVKSTLYLERPSETDTSPEVDSWAMYLDT